jgi:biopolymer transport protein ExbB/TolQ
VSIVSLDIDSRLSPDPKKNWALDRIVLSLRIFGLGLYTLFLFIVVWWRLGILIRLERYIQAVYVLLFLMAQCLLMVVLERSIKYRAARNQSRVFAREVGEAWHHHNLDQVMAITQRYGRSPSARISASGLARSQAAIRVISDAEAISATTLATKRSAAIVRAELKRGVIVLASIGSTAPLVGVLGTVLGIVDSFVGCGAARITCMAATADGISNALLLTASSLALGVLTMWCYKNLNSQLEVFDMEMENEVVSLVNHLVVHLGSHEDGKLN